MPPIYQFRVRSRVFRWYGQLRQIESGLAEPPIAHAALAQQLDELERRVGQVSVPLSYADEWYALRQHIDLVRQKLQHAAGLHRRPSI